MNEEGSLLKSIIVTFLLMALGGILHELDIASTCEKQGNSGYAMWYHKIECKVIKE